MHLDSKGPRIARPKGDVILLRKAGNVFVVEENTQPAESQIFTGRLESGSLRDR